MRKLTGLLFIAVTWLAGLNGMCTATPVAIDVGDNKFILPLQQVSAVQLYSFKEGKGFPAVESAVYSRSKFKISVGAAAVLGSSVNVPFASASFRLPQAIFDTNNNDLYFGGWVGKPSDGSGVIGGISASTALW